VMARKASPTFLKTCYSHQPAFAETESVMRTGRYAHSIRARGSVMTPHQDAGYMAATDPSAEQRGSSCTAGRTIYGMKFVFADSMDCVDPNFDFIKDQTAATHRPYWDDQYPHEILGDAPYDGMLVSRAIVG
jgi:hypothetical protein